MEYDDHNSRRNSQDDMSGYKGEPEKSRILLNDASKDVETDRDP